jgi:hypothetical protein
MTEEVKTLGQVAYEAGDLLRLRMPFSALNAPDREALEREAAAVEAEVLRRQGPLIADLIKVATGKIHHTYEFTTGLCPDEVEGYATRDPKCPACRIIMAAEGKE